MPATSRCCGLIGSNHVAVTVVIVADVASSSRKSGGREEGSIQVSPGDPMTESKMKLGAGAVGGDAPTPGARAHSIDARFMAR